MIKTATDSDKVDVTSKVTLSRAGALCHIGVGKAHTGKTVAPLTTKTLVTVIDSATEEQLSDHLTEPEKNFWRAK